MSRLHFLLESELLTEIDGIATTPPQLVTSRGLFRQQDNTSGTQSTEAQHVHELFDHQLQLQLILNGILVELYTTSKAYVHPNDIGESVSRISRELEQWYRSLPLSMQFSRGIMRNGTAYAQSNALVSNFTSSRANTDPNRAGFHKSILHASFC